LARCQIIASQAAIAPRGATLTGRELSPRWWCIAYFIGWRCASATLAERRSLLTPAEGSMQLSTRPHRRKLGVQFVKRSITSPPESLCACAQFRDFIIRR
jgi:hypothetical protein